MGDPRIPYDRTDPTVPVAAPQGAPSALPGGQPPDLGQLAPAQGGGASSILAGLGGADQGQLDPTGGLGGGLPQGGGFDPAAGAGTTDDLTGAQLGELTSPLQATTPEEVEVAQLEAALDDPNTPPEVKTQIQQMLDLAARRRLAGFGGASQGGGF